MGLQASEIETPLVKSLDPDYLGPNPKSVAVQLCIFEQIIHPACALLFTAINIEKGILLGCFPRMKHLKIS